MGKSGKNKRQKISPLIILALVILFAVTAILVLQKYDVNRYLRTSVGTSTESRSMMSGDFGDGLDMPQAGPGLISETPNCTEMPMLPGSCVTPTPLPATSIEPQYFEDPFSDFFSSGETKGKVAGTDAGTCPEPTVMCIGEFKGPMMYEYWFDIETEPRRKVSIADTDVRKILGRICQGTPKISGCEGVKGNAAMGCANTEYKSVIGAPRIELVGLMSKIERERDVYKYGIHPQGARVEVEDDPEQPEDDPKQPEFWTTSNVYPAPDVIFGIPGGRSDIIELIEWTNTYKLSSQNIKDLNKYHSGLVAIASGTIKFTEDHEDYHLSIWRQHEYGLTYVMNFLESLVRKDYDTPEDANENVLTDISDKFKSRWGKIDAQIEKDHKDFDAETTWESGEWEHLPIDGLEGIACPEVKWLIANVSFKANAGGIAKMRDASVDDAVAVTLTSSGQWIDKKFLYGSTVSLKAIPNEGYEFVKWKGDNLSQCGCEGQGAGCMMGASGKNRCQAIFRESGLGSSPGMPLP